MEEVVGATTVVGVALPTEEAGGDTTMSEGEQFKIFSLACIHVPSLYYGGCFLEGEGGGERILPLPLYKLTFHTLASRLLILPVIDNTINLHNCHACVYFLSPAADPLRTREEVILGMLLHTVNVKMVMLKIGFGTSIWCV